MCEVKQKDEIPDSLAIKKNTAYTKAYLVWGACHYALGSYRRVGEDLDTAAGLGCRDAQFRSKYAIDLSEKGVEDSVESWPRGSEFKGPNQE